MKPFSLFMLAGEPQSFDFTVRPTTGYPVDLYFLIDYSNSLRPFIATMKSLSTQLGMISAIIKHGKC